MTIQYENESIAQGTTEDGINWYMIPDNDPGESPRDWDNLGTMYCEHPRYTLGDKDAIDPRDLDPKEIGVLLLIYAYEHGQISLSTKHVYPYTDVWDSGIVGAIYVTRKTIESEYGYKRLTKSRRDQIAGYLAAEVEVYSQYLQGEVYGIVLTDKYDREIDSCWGYIGYDDTRTEAIRRAGYHKDIDPVHYTLEPATNLPDKDQWFVTCDCKDMIPYRSKTGLVKTFWDAVKMIGYHANENEFDSIDIVWKH